MSADPPTGADRLSATRNLRLIEVDLARATTPGEAHAAIRIAGELADLIAIRRRPWLAGLRPFGKD